MARGEGREQAPAIAANLLHGPRRLGPGNGARKPNRHLKLKFTRSPEEWNELLERDALEQRESLQRDALEDYRAAWTKFGENDPRQLRAGAVASFLLRWRLDLQLRGVKELGSTLGQPELSREAEAGISVVGHHAPLALSRIRDGVSAENVLEQFNAGTVRALISAQEKTRTALLSIPADELVQRAFAGDEGWLERLRADVGIKRRLRRDRSWGELLSQQALIRVAEEVTRPESLPRANFILKRALDDEAVAERRFRQGPQFP